MVKYTPTRVKHPYDYNYIKMKYPGIGIQQEKLGQRLASLMNKHKMKPKDVALFSNLIADNYGFKVTEADIRNYLNGVSPKVDKLHAIMKMFGVDEVYMCGYGFSPKCKRR